MDLSVKYPLSHVCMSFGIWDDTKCRVVVLIVPLLPVLFQDATDVITLETQALLFPPDYRTRLDEFCSLREEFSFFFGTRDTSGENRPGGPICETDFLFLLLCRFC